MGYSAEDGVAYQFTLWHDPFPSFRPQVLVLPSGEDCTINLLLGVCCLRGSVYDWDETHSTR